MTTPVKNLPLASEFPPASREQWLKLVDGVLKGAAFDKKLVNTTDDSLRIEPLYARAPDARPLAGRKPGAPWQIMARVDHPNAEAANQQALDDLKNGATGLVLVTPNAVGARGFGIGTAKDEIAHILDGVFLDAGAPIEFQLSFEDIEAVQHVAALVAKQRLDPARCDLRAGFDPIGAIAAGKTSGTWNKIAPTFVAAIRTLREAGFPGPFAVADARPVHDAGGSEAQELGFALATALAYLRALEESGIALEDARRMIFFRLSADADQFLTIAKFRALRKLWARVEEECGLKPAPAFIAAETAWRMMTQRDPYVNMLRVTIAAFAAGLGGADAVTVLPFTNALGLPDGFARRVARNTQLLLLEESNLAKVADPAAGSGGIEDLTDQLCKAGWDVFQHIEKAGGISAALEQSLIQPKIWDIRDARNKALSTRKKPLTGTSEFPNLHEAPVRVEPVNPYAEKVATENFPPLEPHRLSEPFEKLRNASDRILQKTGARPKVFLANLGRPADFIARSTYAKNFFEVGGIEAVEYAPDDSVTDGLAAAFKQSGAQLACLCSSDEVYAGAAIPTAQALAQAEPLHIYLAGRPGENAQDLQKAGVATFIHAGCDLLAILQKAHDIVERDIAERR